MSYSGKRATVSPWITQSGLQLPNKESVASLNFSKLLHSNLVSPELLPLLGFYSHESCKSQLPLNSSWGLNLFMDPHLLWGEPTGSSPTPAYPVQSPQAEKFYMEATMGSDPKMKPLRVCLQASECCFAACWAVLQGQHIRTHPIISHSPCWGWPGPSPQRMKWSLSWVMCNVHNSVLFSPFKMPTSVFTKSLGATVHPVVDGA